MSHLLERVRGEISAHELLRRGQRLLVAVSGGVDSVVLLHVLHRLAPEFRCRLEAAHFNHQLRGRPADADERFTRQQAGQLGIPFHAGRGDVKAHARKARISVEMAGRELRHRFLCDIAKKRRLETIALAHHADDQLELLFLRLLRGSGSQAFHGMALTGASWLTPKVTLMRPLLAERKEALVEYARANRLRWREDKSNNDPAMLRNRVRHQLLPAVQRVFGKNALEPVLHLADISASEGDFVEGVARDWLETGRGSPFDLLHPAVQRQVIKLQLTALGLLPGYAWIEQLRLEANAKMAVEVGVLIWRDALGSIHKEVVQSLDVRLESMPVTLEVKGGVDFGGLALAWKVTKAPKPFRKPDRVAGQEVFDAQQVGPEVVLRHWRPGDRFQPIGMAGEVKLQDLFTNARIDRARRRSLVLATTVAGQIFWVEGLRMAEKFKVSPRTRSCLKWQWGPAARADLKRRLKAGSSR